MDKKIVFAQKDFNIGGRIIKLATTLKSTEEGIAGDEEEGKGEIDSEKEKKIIDYVKSHSNLNDTDFHSFVESIGVDPHEAEEVIYKAFQKCSE